MKTYKYTKYITIDGHRYAIRANTKEELGRKIERKIQSVKAEEKAASSRTVADWTAECIALYKTNQAEITRKKFVGRVRHCILEEIGAMPLASITPERCQYVLNQQAGNSKAQISEVYNALKFIFRHAFFRGLIPSDPTAMLVKPKGTYTPRRALTDAERDAFLKVAPTDRKYYGFLLGYYCGLRPSEAAEAEGRDLVVRSGRNFLHVRGTKTAKADRFVPVPDELFRLIGSTPKNEKIAVYPSGHTTNDENRGRLWRGLWYWMNKEAGAEMYRNEIITPAIQKDLTPYCLRHDYCTRLAKAGVDIRTAQKLMGHSTIQLTANVYTHVDDDELAKAADLIAAATPTATPLRLVVEN